MYEVVETIPNDGPDELTVIVEPWGMPLSLMPGHSFSLIGRASSEGHFEISKQADAVMVYAWPGSTVEVFDGDVLVESFAIRVPPVPSGQSVRGFLDFMLGKSQRGDCDIH